MWVADDNQQCLSSADGNVESLWVGEESEMMADIRLHQLSCRTYLHVHIHVCWEMITMSLIHMMDLRIDLQSEMKVLFWTTTLEETYLPEED